MFEHPNIQRMRKEFETLRHYNLTPALITLHPRQVEVLKLIESGQLSAIPAGVGKQAIYELLFSKDVTPTQNESTDNDR